MPRCQLLFGLVEDLILGFPRCSLEKKEDTDVIVPFFNLYLAPTTFTYSIIITRFVVVVVALLSFSGHAKTRQVWSTAVAYTGF